MSTYTIEQRSFVLKRWWQLNCDYRQVRIAFTKRFPDVEPPARSTIWRLDKKLDATGSCGDGLRSGRPKKARSDEKIAGAKKIFVNGSDTSIRDGALKLNVSKSSVQRILTKDMGKHFYHPLTVQELKDPDHPKRLEFCNWFVNTCQQDSDYINRVLWTDEAVFKTNGRVNRRNCGYWSDVNLHTIQQKPLNVPGIAVWAGISPSGIVGPYFFEETITGASYEEMLTTIFEDLDVYARPDLIWQQDGAPAHFALDVRAVLNDRFPQWIGRAGTISWPPRSPDLTPMDFAVWGIVKDRVYLNRPQTKEDLREEITAAFEEIFSDELCKNICESAIKRYKMCINQNGGHFQQFLRYSSQ